MRRFTVDWDSVYERVQPFSVFVAGALFGLAWWLWADAIAVSIALQHASFNPLSVLPAIAATVAVCIMNCVSREDVEHAYNDDAYVMRSKLVRRHGDAACVSLPCVQHAVVVLYCRLYIGCALCGPLEGGGDVPTPYIHRCLTQQARCALRWQHVASAPHVCCAVVAPRRSSRSATSSAWARSWARCCCCCRRRLRTQRMACGWAR